MDPEYADDTALLKTGFIVTWMVPPQYFPMGFYLFLQYAGYEQTYSENTRLKLNIDGASIASLWLYPDSASGRWKRTPWYCGIFAANQPESPLSG